MNGWIPTIVTFIVFVIIDFVIWVITKPPKRRKQDDDDYPFTSWGSTH